MISPEVGQIVRLPDHDEKLVVKDVSSDEKNVDLVTMTDHPDMLAQVPVEDLLPGEDLSAG